MQNPLTKKCDKCGGTMFVKLIDYTTRIYGENVIIEDIQGYRCINCDHAFITEAAKPYYKQKILEKKLELIKRAKVKPIFINYIEKIRAERGLTQKELAEVFEFSEQRYGAIERNVNTPTIFINYQLAHLFDVSADDIYKLIYIPENFYNELINTAWLEEERKFIYVKEAEIARKNLQEIRKKIDDENRKMTDIRTRRNRGEFTHKEADKMLDEIKDFKEKNYVPIKEKYEGELKEIYKKYTFVIRRDHTIKWDHWELVKKHFKDELDNIIIE